MGFNLSGKTAQVGTYGILIEIMAGGALLFKNCPAFQDLTGVSGNFRSKLLFFGLTGKKNQPEGDNYNT